MNEALHGIVELPTYTRLADKLLSTEERQDLIDYLAEHPKAGDVMEGTSGGRKLRWRRGGQGKSGGVRVSYYYHDDLMPLYLLTLFAKDDKANLTKAERNDLADLVDVLVEIWRGKTSCAPHSRASNRACKRPWPMPGLMSAACAYSVRAPST